MSFIQLTCTAGIFDKINNSINNSSEYKTELEEVIKDETSGDFTTALLSMLGAKRDESTEVDMELARKDAKVKRKKKQL